MAGKFVIKAGKTGKFRFNLMASNGQTILTSEAYETRAAANKGIASVMKNAGNDKRFERKKAKDGSPFFVMKAANGEPIGKSEMYKTIASMENGVSSVGKHAPNASISDASAKPNKAAAKSNDKAASKPAAKPAAKKPAKKAAAKTAAKPAVKKAAAKPAAKKAAPKPAAKKAAAKKPAAKAVAKSTAKPAAKKAAAKKPAAKKAAANKPAAKKAAKKASKK